AYRMLRSLGSGTQASVRLAGREDTAELFACKSYLKNPSGGEPVALRRELRILERYRHPHVVGFVEHFESKSKHYVVLEFCEGPDLQRYLSMRGGRLPDGEVRAISGTLLRTLFFLHSQGVVHRDLKPANVLIRDIDRPAETLCLADFGSAHASSSSASSASSVDTPSPIGLRSLAGTPYYLAPEIVGGRPYDSAVDMWSLGCILYQLIHGHTPFELVTSFADLYRQIGAAQIEFPETAPADLRSFLSGLLQPDPTSRMTASEALAHAWMDAA
ncbi:kinase-like domain-containing protein, partial [Hyaloraphidium curvatum]